MFYNAIKAGVSSLHFEPYKKFYRVRFRINGILQIVAELPISLARVIAARIKVISCLDVSERCVPQDSFIRLKIAEDKKSDFQVSTCPTLLGRKDCHQNS